MPGSTRRVPRFCFAIAAVATLLATGGWAGASHGGARPAPGPAGPAVEGSPVPGWVPSTPWATGGTAASLVLFNSTRLGGVFAGAEPLLPTDSLYDAANETVWVAANAYVGILNGSTESGVAWVPVFGSSAYLALDNRTNTVLVTNPLAGSVTAINATNHSVARTGPVQSTPEGIAFDYRDNTAFVANSINGTVSVLNASTLASVALLHVGKSPQGVAYDPTDDRVFVANSQSKNISLINASADTVLGNMTIASSTPTHVVFDSSIDRLFVDGITGAVDVIDPVKLTVVTSLHAGIFVDALGLNAAGSVIYLGDRIGETVTAVSTSTFSSLGAFGLGSQPASITYDAIQGAVLVVNSPASSSGVANVTIASASSLRSTGAIPLQHYPSAMVWVGKRHAVYVYDGGSGQLLELNATTFALNRTLFVGYSPGALSLPGGLAYDPNDGRLFVSVSGPLATFVAVVSAATLSLVQNDVVGKQPAAIAFDTTDDLAYVVNYGSNNLSVLRGSTGAVAGRVNVQAAPTADVWDPATDAVYVTDSAKNNVSIVAGANFTVSRTVAVGGDPVALALDTGLGRVAVANAASNNLTLLDPASGATVGSIALPATLAPTQVAYDPANGTLEVSEGILTNPFGDLVVINDTNLSFAAEFSTVPFGNAVLYDGASGLTLVAGEATGVLSFVNLTIHPNLRIQSFSTLFTNISVDTPTSFSVSVTGGAPPFVYGYSGLPGGCASNDTPFLACTPNATGNFTVAVNVSDAVGELATSSLALNIAPLPPPGLSINVSISPSTIALGNSTTLWVNATGGYPPYGYSYPALPPGCVDANVTPLVCTPTVVANYTIPIRVTDSFGDLDSATVQLNVTVNHTVAPPPPLTLRSFSATPASVALGDIVTLAANVTGGATPYSYVYAPVPAGCTPTNAPRWSCTPSVTGTFTIDLRVTDANGSVVKGETNLTVGPAKHGTTPGKNSSGGGLPLSEIEEILGALAVVVVLILVALVLTRRKPAAPTPATEGPEPEK